MQRKRLIETLESLQRELREGDVPDPETSELLSQVESQIQRLRAGEPVEPTSHSAFTEQLEATVARLEAGHPNLALLARQVIGALSAMGI